MQTSHTIIINRPVEYVFAYVTDVTNDLHWQPEIIDVQLTSTPPVGVGTAFIEIRKTLGVRFVWHMRVTDFAPNEQICIESVKGTVPYRGCRIFEQVNAGTSITETSNVVLPFWLRPFSKSIAQSSVKSVAQAYQKLKLILEANGT